MNGFSRKAAVITAVLVLHVAAVWALNAGLRTRVAEVLVPVQLLAQLVERPQPAADVPAAPALPAVPVKPVGTAPAAPRSPPMPTPQPEQMVPRKAVARPAPTPSLKSAPVPAAIAVPSPVPPAVGATPSPNAATASSDPDTAPKGALVAAPAAITAPKMAAAAPPSLPAQVAVELPSSDARYLQNPKPRYPPISHRLGEQGTVQIQVLVTDQGIARDARIQSSSGFSRLDNAALSSVLTWRFVPGKRAGVAETMWFTVPITFDLK
jgi:protein TonB